MTLCRGHAGQHHMGQGLSKAPLTKWYRALGGETATLVGPVTEGLERQDETALELKKISDL